MVEFPETEEGAELMKAFDRLGIRARLQVRRWCEWQLKKWGRKGAEELVERMLRRCLKCKNPAANVVWLAKRGNEIHFMDDETYFRFKMRHRKAASDYVGWKLDESPEGLGSIEDLVQQHRERYRLRRSTRPPAIDW